MATDLNDDSMMDSELVSVLHLLHCHLNQRFRISFSFEVCRLP